ncbi:GAF domain-containing protein [Nocardioides cavernae]|uniref:GAF domain-containing protein n=1 Tax=Nocardioides cavernae TaxID=1921566 RepID=A0A7Y9H3P9_9ACTN|nr:GAF domain-containing protein [Nocardioides cavernae]NYE37397.1 GAF domain-containing protein [Nocardioides cavernae]
MGPRHDDVQSLEELRRRADELSVLNDLARRLAALHDTREVLDEVARQARRLLGADVAYIMLLRGDRLRIEVVDGAMGSAMRGIELAPAQGLGGQVLATGRPLWSGDYLHDSRFRRTEGAESAAQSEQLGGILGVPLVVGDDTLGVLLAAERRPRPFVDHDVELLAGLAAHAALALRTADLFDRERAAAAELRQANATLREISESRQRASDLRDVLNEVVIRGGGLPEVVAALDRAAGLTVEVRDADGRTLAGERATDDGLVVPVDLPDGRVGDLVASPPDAAGATDEDTHRLLRIGATTVAVLVASERSVAEAELRTRGELVHALLSSDADEDSLVRRARAVGIDLRAVAAVAVVEPEPVGVAHATAYAARLAADLRGWSATHAGRVIVLAPTGVEDAREAAARLSAREAPTTGLAAAAGGLAGVRAAHEEARQTAALLLALGRPGTCAAADDLGLYRSLFSGSGREELATFVRTTIGPLLDHDRERQRDLATTLENYLEHARHHARTCEALHIHPNTLYQRLDRVTEVLGTQWKEPGRALELQVALRLHRLMAELST